MLITPRVVFARYRDDDIWHERMLLRHGRDRQAVVGTPDTDVYPKIVKVRAAWHLHGTHLNRFRTGGAPPVFQRCKTRVACVLDAPKTSACPLENLQSTDWERRGTSSSCRDSKGGCVLLDSLRDLVVDPAHQLRLLAEAESALQISGLSLPALNPSLARGGKRYGDFLENLRTA